MTRAARPAPEDTPGALDRLGREEAAGAAAFLAGALPAALRPAFGASFVRSHLLYGEFVCRLVLGVARATGLAAALGIPGTARELTERAGLAAAQALVPIDWMLRFLAGRGFIESLAGGGEARYRASAELPALDPMPVRDEQRRTDASWMPAYVLAETVAGDYPAFLRGEAAGEDILFAPRRLRLWVDYFSNDNGLYAVNNRVGAVAAADWLPERGGVVLELGGGLGSGALALLGELETRGRLGRLEGYRFTEPVGAFQRRGAQALAERFPSLAGLAAGELDMNRPFGEQGVAAGGAALIYAVNTLHVARDLGATLGEIRRALEPGGRLVIAECVPPVPPIYAEFVFNLAETFRSPVLHPDYRPHGGFLALEHWTAAMEAAGLTDVRVLPDVARVRAGVPDWSVAAIGATRPATG